MSNLGCFRSMRHEGAAEELSDGGSPRVIVYGYDGLPMQPVASPSQDYVPRPEHPPSPHYILGPEHPPSPAEDHADYLADGGGDDDEPSNDDDDDTDDEDEEPFEDDDEDEEEHLAPANSSAIPVVDPIPSAGDTKAFETDEATPTPIPSPRRHTARISIRPEAPMPFPLEEKVKRLLALPPPPQSPLISLSPPSAEECLARATMGRLRASSPSTHHPLHLSPPLPLPPSSLHLPLHVPTSLPLPSSPLPALLFIPPPVDRREDIPEAELPPHKRLCLTALTSRYEVGESSTATPRPTRVHRVDYGFTGTLDSETRHRRAKEVGYGIRNVWVDLTEAVEELALMTLEGDTQDKQTQLFQRVDGLVEDRQFHYETARLLDQEALMHDYRIASQESLMMALIAQISSLYGQLLVALGYIQALQARDQTHADDREGTASTTVGLVFSFLVSDNHNNMPPRRSCAAATPVTAAAVEQLIEARVSAALTNHEAL
ncbi:hypothetical protein Tco_0446625 [Tanacetum coccineum]